MFAGLVREVFTQRVECDVYVKERCCSGMKGVNVLDSDCHELGAEVRREVDTGETG